ncbi:MAG: hypothetical protein LBH79_07805 [Nitrososphaerota archaeon]|jgi:hypothetical protein|nr:hypothetical protein [Nitrososphaerota archaeon]
METITGKRILQSLYEKQIIGAKHTSTDNATKCLPKNMRGDGEKILKQLRKQGYINFHPTSYGMEVSLNPTKIVEIRKIIR